MTTKNDALKGCPVCGGEAGTNTSDAQRTAWCLNGQCKIYCLPINYTVWQALPRVSTAVRDVMGEMTRQMRSPGCSTGESTRLRIWRDRLSECADGGECERCVKDSDTYILGDEIWCGCPECAEGGECHICHKPLSEPGESYCSAVHVDSRAPVPSKVWVGEGVRRIASERQRQQQEEGWSLDHDRETHPDRELVDAALCYVAAALRCPKTMVYESWPWGAWEGFEPKADRLRNLEIAGALIAAEIDRCAPVHGAAPEKGETCETCGADKLCPACYPEEQASWLAKCKQSYNGSYNRTDDTSQCECEAHCFIEWKGFQQEIIAIHDKRVNGCSGPFRLVLHGAAPEKERPSTITPEEVQAVMDRPADPTLQEDLRRVFRRPVSDVRLGSSAAPEKGETCDPDCEDCKERVKELELEAGLLNATSEAACADVDAANERVRELEAPASCTHCHGPMGAGAVCERCHELLYDKPVPPPVKVCMLVPRHIDRVGGIKLFADPTVVEGNKPGDVLITHVPVLGVPPRREIHTGHCVFCDWATGEMPSKEATVDAVRTHILTECDQVPPTDPDKVCACGAKQGEPCKTKDDLPNVTCMNVGELIDEVATLAPEAEQQPAFLELARRIRRDHPDLYPARPQGFFTAPAHARVAELRKEVEGLEEEVLRWKNNTDEERGKRYEAEQRAKRATQAIIAELGSMGPESIENAVHRAVVALTARDERADELQRKLDGVSVVYGEALAAIDISEQEVADLQGLLAEAPVRIKCLEIQLANLAHVSSARRDAKRLAEHRARNAEYRLSAMDERRSSFVREMKAMEPYTETINRPCYDAATVNTLITTLLVTPSLNEDHHD